MATTTIKEAKENYSKDSSCKKLIDEMNKYEDFLETVEMIEGIISGRGIHAAGVIISNEDYYENIPCMTSTNKLLTTQYDLNDCSYLGGLKLDFLSITALDRIRKCFNLLLKHDKITWEGNLRNTYNKYLHPTELEYENEEMFKILYSGELIDAFQFDSIVGSSALRKVKPTKLSEIIITNSLMRLSSEGKQPIDKFIENRENINLAYEEMKTFDLNDDEIKTIESFLKRKNFVADTQEDVMKMAMSEKIANFTFSEANYLRKGIAKKDPILQEEVKQLFYKKGLEKGNRKQILDYVWEIQIKTMLGYSFSEPHTAGYSLILLQEMNLAWKFTPLYWKVACLSIKAGTIDEQTQGGTSYGEIGKAIANTKNFVMPPDINLSEREFIPNEKENKCIYSISAIHGIGDSIVDEIIKNRPYNNFDHFLEKCIDTKLITQLKGFNLIKAGCFDKFNPNRRELMVKYINYTHQDKQKLTTANIPKLIEYNLIPDKYKEEVELYKYKKLIFTKQNIFKEITKTNFIYIVPKNCINYVQEYVLKENIDCIEYNCDGDLCINSKVFDKWYKTKIEKLVDWIKTDEALMIMNNYTKSEVWNKNCLGTTEKWEFEALSFYTNKHELDLMPIKKYYNLDNFNEMSYTPVIVEERKVRNRTYPIFKISTIAGTVISKDKNKHIITLNTKDGAVDVKFSKEQFLYYDRTIDNEGSWFDRGTILIVHGYRRESLFIPKVYKNSIQKHSLIKIKYYNENQIYFQLDKNLESEIEYV